MPKLSMAHNLIVFNEGVNAAKVNAAAAPHKRKDENGAFVLCLRP